jgi:hypothetical protein
LTPQAQSETKEGRAVIKGGAAFCLQAAEAAAEA